MTINPHIETAIRGLQDEVAEQRERTQPTGDNQESNEPLQFDAQEKEHLQRVMNVCADLSAAAEQALKAIESAPSVGTLRQGFTMALEARPNSAQFDDNGYERTFSLVDAYAASGNTDTWRQGWVVLQETRLPLHGADDDVSTGPYTHWDFTTALISMPEGRD